MPIKFNVYPHEGYYIARFTGVITDSELLDDFRRFFTGSEWFPGLNELADISLADVNHVTTDGVKKLAKLIGGIVRLHDFSPRVAVYAPNDLPYGLSRIYSAEATSFETHKVFRNYDDARAWLLKMNGKDNRSMIDGSKKDHAFKKSGIKPEEPMKFDINFEHLPDYVLIKTQGEASVEGFNALLSTLVNSPEWIIGTDQIVDHRNLVIDEITPDDVKGVRDVVKIHSNKLGTGRCAFIVSNKLGFGFIRMYDIIGGEKIHNQVEIFHSVKEAVEWFGKQDT